MIIDVDITVPFTVAFDKLDKSTLADSLLLVRLGTDEFPAGEEDIEDVQNLLYEMQDAQIIPETCFCMVMPHATDFEIKDVPILKTIEDFCKEYKANNVNVSDYIDKFEEMLSELRP